MAGLAVAAAALAAATGLLAAALHGNSNAAQQRAAALAAARQEAVNLTTLNRQTGGREFAAVLAGAAGSLKQQLSQGRGAFLKTLSSADVSSVGSVLDAGIVTMNSRTATVLLNVRATVRNKQTYAPETRLYHWQAGLVNSGGRWLVTSLEFV
jgi:Mce-associated membrane protein